MTRRCSETDLQAFVDNQLPDDRLRDFLDHLQNHPEDLDRAVRYREQRRALVEEIDDALGHPPADLVKTKEALGRQLRRDRRPWPYVRRLTWAASLIAAGWLGGYLQTTYWADPVPDFVADVATGHIVFSHDLERAVELPASASAELVNWFSAHLGTAVEIPALGSVGLSLVGGRLLATEEGPVAQLLYEDLHGRRLTLGLAVQRVEEGQAIRMADLDGLSAGYWQEGELGVAVVSEAPQDQLMIIAAAVEAQIP